MRRSGLLIALSVLACAAASCLPAFDDGQCPSASQDASCEDKQGAFNGRYDQAGEGLGSCVVDGDCVIPHVDLGCASGDVWFASCPSIAVSTQCLDDFKASIAAMEDDYCDPCDAFCFRTHDCGIEEGSALCLGGTCTWVGTVQGDLLRACDETDLYPGTDDAACDDDPPWATTLEVGASCTLPAGVTCHVCRASGSPRALIGPVIDASCEGGSVVMTEHRADAGIVDAGN